MAAPLPPSANRRGQSPAPEPAPPEVHHPGPGLTQSRPGPAPPGLQPANAPDDTVTQLRRLPVISVVRLLGAGGLEGAADTPGYRKRGDEWRGPCPRCGGGGDDRGGSRSDRAGVRAHQDDSRRGLFSFRRCPGPAGLAIALNDRLGPEPRDPNWRPGRPRRSPTAPRRRRPADGRRRDRGAAPPTPETSEPAAEAGGVRRRAGVRNRSLPGRSPVNRRRGRR